MAVKSVGLMPSRITWTSLSEEQLLAQCEVDTYRASGPGGQKRNKTSSAVRLRHVPSGLLVIAEESRSQHENKAKALKRLRQALFLKLREPVIEGPVEEIEAIRTRAGRLEVGGKDARYWPAVARVLDVLEGVSGRVSDAAAALNVSTGNLITLLELAPKAWEEANHLRQRFGHKALKT